MRQKHGEERKRAKPSEAAKRFKSRRKKEVEVWDGISNPIDQAWRGWEFKDWLQRPSAKCEGKRVPRGRLTEELVVHIARFLAEGLYQYHAEALLGLKPRAIENWIRRAKAHEAKRDAWIKRRKRFKTKAGAIESLGPKPPVTLHMQLHEIVRKSETMGETSLFGAIMMAALQGDTKAAMWLLERKRPERYGRLALRTDIEMDENGKAKVNPIRELAAALEAVAERSEA